MDFTKLEKTNSIPRSSTKDLIESSSIVDYVHYVFGGILVGNCLVCLNKVRLPYFQTASAP